VYKSTEWFTLKEAAESTGVSLATIRRRIADGTVPAVRFGPRLLRINASDLTVLGTPLPVDGGE